MLVFINIFVIAFIIDIFIEIFIDILNFELFDLNILIKKASIKSMFIIITHAILISVSYIFLDEQINDFITWFLHNISTSVSTHQINGYYFCCGIMYFSLYKIFYKLIRKGIDYFVCKAYRHMSMKADKK